MRLKLFRDFNRPTDGTYMVVELVAGLCRLSVAFHAVCNSSPNVRRSHSGQQVYTGHACWLETACDDSTAVV